MTFRRIARLLALAVAGALSTACAENGPREGFAETDHHESFSRAMLAGNIRVDRFILRPVAQGYDVVAPDTVKHVLSNGLDHLLLLPDFVNYLLQGDLDRSLNTLGRFTLNTIMGGAGALDPATEFGLRRQPTDFGLTLAHHGVDEGSFLVLPFIGPTTVRDAAGFIVDRAFMPTTYIGALTAVDGLSPGITVFRFVDGRYRNADAIDDLFYKSDDPYVTIRSIYLQRRRALVGRDENPAETLPDIFESDR